MPVPFLTIETMDATLIAGTGDGHHYQVPFRELRIITGYISPEAVIPAAWKEAGWRPGRVHCLGICEVRGAEHYGQRLLRTASPQRPPFIFGPMPRLLLDGRAKPAPACAAEVHP